MQRSWLLKLVLAAALAVLPFQGIAQTVMSLVCHPQGEEHTIQHSGQHAHGGGSGAHGHAHASTHSPVSDDGTTGNGHADHFCCHVVVSGLTSWLSPSAEPGYAVLTASAGVSHYVTFLKRPQRPPLA